MGQKPRRFWVYGVCFVMAFASILAIRPVRAASLSDTYVRFNRMKVSENSTIRIVFRTSATNGTEAKLKFTLDDGTALADGDAYTVNTTQAVSSASCASETGATALPGTLSAAGDNTANSKDIIISGVSDLATSTLYCVDLTTSNAVTNSSSAATEYHFKLATQTSGDVDIDIKYVATRVIADDQIVVTAIVPPSFNFQLSGNTDAFTSNLSPTASPVNATSGRTVTITTNAAKGWIAWVRDSSQGLSSASASYTIPTSGTVNGAPSTIAAGTEGYVLDVDMTTDAGGGGTVTIDPEYNGSGTDQGGTFSATFQPVASSNGTANGDVITLIERAAISAVTPAGSDYTDTLTVIGAGKF